MASLCGDFRPYHLVFAGEFKRYLTRDALLFHRHVALVAGQSHDEAALLVGRILDHFVDPILHSIEGSLVSQVVADYRPNRISVV